jgi:hypothetical protein
MEVVDPVDSIDAVLDMKKGCRDFGACALVGFGSRREAVSVDAVDAGASSPEDDFRRFVAGSPLSVRVD